MSALAPLMSSARQDWETPPELLERVRRVGRIGLDPCASRTGVVKARTEWYGPPTEDDGLANRWAPSLRRGDLAWCNPPFSSLATWVDKAISEWTGMCLAADDPALPAACCAPGSAIVLLSPARTDTRWFVRLVEHARAICFLSGRLTFLGAPNPAPFPTAVTLLGGPAMGGRFAEAFAGAGWMHARSM